MEQFDAIVVGGGPAGSTFAWKMVQSGRRVAILDQALFPRVKLCAGWITPPVLDALELDLKEYQRGRTFQEFKGFILSRISGNVSTFYFPSPVSFGIIRSEFDEYLLRRSGAEVFQECRVRDIHHESGSWILNKRFCAPVLVGAGGHFCPVARYLGVTKRKEKVLSTLELELEMNPEELLSYHVDPEKPVLSYFDDIRGYGWCFRKGLFLNIGVGRTKSFRLRDFLNLFLESLVERGLIPKDSRFFNEKFLGHAYKLYFVTPRPTFGEGALLIGDSAGLSFNYSGEGIRPAVESALMAWKTVRDSEGNYSKARLSRYRDLLYEAYGEPVTGLKFRIMESLPPACFQTIGRTIFSSHRLKEFFLRKWFLRVSD